MVFTCAADQECVRLIRSDRAEPVVFGWAELDEIQSHKRDLFATGEVCLAIRIGDACHELWESDPGLQAVGYLDAGEDAVDPGEPAVRCHVSAVRDEAAPALATQTHDRVMSTALEPREFMLPVLDRFAALWEPFFYQRRTVRRVGEARRAIFMAMLAGYR